MAEDRDQKVRAIMLNAATMLNAAKPIHHLPQHRQMEMTPRTAKSPVIQPQPHRKMPNRRPVYHLQRRSNNRAAAGRADVGRQMKRGKTATNLRQRQTMARSKVSRPTRHHPPMLKIGVLLKKLDPGTSYELSSRGGPGSGAALFVVQKMRRTRLPPNRWDMTCVAEIAHYISGRVGEGSNVAKSQIASRAGRAAAIRAGSSL